MGDEEEEERRQEGEGRKDERIVMQEREWQIPHNHVLLMCSNVRERVFINTVDAKHKASFKSIKSTLHQQTLSTWLLARQRLQLKEASVYGTIIAASKHIPISSLTTVSFIGIIFN